MTMHTKTELRRRLAGQDTPTMALQGIARRRLDEADAQRDTIRAAFGVAIVGVLAAVAGLATYLYAGPTP